MAEKESRIKFMDEEDTTTSSEDDEESTSKFLKLLSGKKIHQNKQLIWKKKHVQNNKIIF